MSMVNSCSKVRCSFVSLGSEVSKYVKVKICFFRYFLYQILIIAITNICICIRNHRSIGVFFINSRPRIIDIGSSLCWSYINIDSSCATSAARLVSIEHLTRKEIITLIKNCNSRSQECNMSMNFKNMLTE